MSPAATPSPSATTKASDPGTPKNDHRILIVVVVLTIAAAFLIAYIIFITIRLRRRQANGESSGPYQGTVMNQDHPAAQITPFGGGPHSGGQGPRFKRNPGEDMRIAIRRPDGAWHFADSRTPFTPSGVTDIDVLPSPTSSSTSLFSFNSRQPLASKKAQEAKLARAHRGYDAEFDFEASRTIPPPPAYYREPCREHFDDNRTPI